MTFEPTAAGVLIEPDDLARWLAADRPPVVLDVRWSLGRSDGAELYRAGHIPGAVYADLDTELAGPASPADGRHPLPELGVLEVAARRWGARADQAVVAYDDSGGLAAARAWWLLGWAGVADVRLLNGGLAAWRSSGRGLSSGVEGPARPGDVTLSAGHRPTVSADEAAVLARSGTLVDARAGERFRGEAEPIDPRAGHIPGAVSAPTTENLDPSGRFRSPAELRARFTELGVGPDVAAYCGSGVTAAHEIVALTVAGYRPALYPGSWSQWSADPSRPVATGAGD